MVPLARAQGIPLVVSYDDRQVAKDAGARWNGEKKQWMLALPAAFAHKARWPAAYLAVYDELLLEAPLLLGAPEGASLPINEEAVYTGGNGWTEFS